MTDATTILPPQPISDEAGRLEPFDWYASRRETDPVAYDERRETWDVFRYEDVTRILTDEHRFSPNVSHAATVDDATDAPLAASMVQSDPPAHGRRREFAEPAFAPDQIDRLRPRIREIAGTFLTEESGEVSFVESFAAPFPVAVIAELMDVPRDRRETFGEWVRTLVAHPATADEAAELADRRREAQRSLHGLFDRLLDERADSDGRDLVTMAANMERLSRRETIQFCVLLLTAGSVSTESLLTNAVWCLASRGLLDDTLDRSRAIDEVLRYRSPEQALRRVVVADTVVGGKTLAAGDVVTVWLGSANRDPAAFDDPATFCPDRHPNPHLAFGAGSHYCLGAPLARLEASVTLELLTDRYADIEPDVSDLAPKPGFPYYGLESLTCRVTV